VDQFHFDPASYLELMHDEVPEFEVFQEAVARATAGVDAHRLLELGTGTGETARRVLALHPGARLTGIDSSEAMLARAGLDADLVVQRIQDPLPAGPYELVFSALVVHHLDSAEKRDLFARVRDVLAPGGRFVLGDVVVPERPEDVVTPITAGFDKPDTVADQLAWLAAAGFEAHLVWSSKDVAVLAATH
jgi:SAM-dependent methyltransferase